MDREQTIGMLIILMMVATLVLSICWAMLYVRDFDESEAAIQGRQEWVAMREGIELDHSADDGVQPIKLRD